MEVVDPEFATTKVRLIKELEEAQFDAQRLVLQLNGARKSPNYLERKAQICPLAKTAFDRLANIQAQCAEFMILPELIDKCEEARDCLRQIYPDLDERGWPVISNRR